MANQPHFIFGARVLAASPPQYRESEKEMTVRPLANYSEAAERIFMDHSLPGRSAGAPRRARSASTAGNDLDHPYRPRRAYNTCARLSPNSYANPVVIKKKSPLPPSPAGSPTSQIPTGIPTSGNQCRPLPSVSPAPPEPAASAGTERAAISESCWRLVAEAELSPVSVIDVNCSAGNTSPPAGNSVPPLLRLSPEIFLEIVGKYPPNLAVLRRTCRVLYFGLSEPALATAVPIAQVGMADAGRHAVSCGCDDAEVVDRLLDRGTDASSLLEWACLLNRKKLVRHLLEFSSASSPDASRVPRVRPTQKALCWASSRGHVSVVCTLLKAGCRPDEDSLRSAARNNHLSLVRLLLEAGAEPSSSALESALRANHLALVELLLEAGAPPSDDVLSAAAYQGSADIVHLLLAKGAHVSERAIDYASWGGHEAIVQMLEGHAPFFVLAA